MSGGMFGSGRGGPPNEEVGICVGGGGGGGSPGENGKFLGMDGLSSRDGDSGAGGGGRILFMNLRKAFDDAGLMGSGYKPGKYGPGIAYGLNCLAKCGLK